MPKDKFEEHSKKCIFVRYPHERNGWKVYNLENGNISVSHDIICHKEKFPFFSSIQSCLSSDGEWGGVQNPGIFKDMTRPTSLQYSLISSAGNHDLAQSHPTTASEIVKEGIGPAVTEGHAERKTRL